MSWRYGSRLATVAFLGMYVMVLAGAVAVYALSPIDLIPDFIPVLGYLDDLLIVPAGIWLVLKLIPAPLMAEFGEKAARRAERPTSYGAAAAVALVWVVLAVVVIWLLLRQNLTSLLDH